MLSAVVDTSGVAIITGGASGFGLEVATRCAAAGMRTALLDVNAEVCASAQAGGTAADPAAAGGGGCGR